jgi:hypothetical protein
VNRWAALWSGRESPWRLGLVRLLLGLVLVVEYAWIAHLDLVVPLFATLEDGGLVEHGGSWVHAMGPWATWGTLLGASVALLLGVAPRVAAVVLVVVGAAHGAAVPIAHRAADQLVRDVLCVLVFAETARWGSLAAWWRTGTPLGDGGTVAAWPRRLLVVQLVLVYVFAGLQKVDAAWWPWGGATALFVILSDPAVARFDDGWLRAGGWPVASVLTVATVGFQLAYPLVLVLWRTRLHTLFLVVGVGFHLGLAATMELGLFPWAMLALYPALLRDLAPGAGPGTGSRARSWNRARS